MNVEVFQQLLECFLSPDGNLRTKAEEKYNEMKQQQPDQLVHFLLHFLKSSPSEQARELSAVLLRREVLKVKDSLWKKLSPQTQEFLKTEILEILKNEPASKTRHKIADVISELADSVSENGQWSQLLPSILHLAKSSNPGHRESSFKIFSQLVQYLGEALIPHIAMIRDLLLQGLTDPQLEVQLSALNASSSFVQCLPQFQQDFQTLLQPMLQIVLSSIQQNKEEEATEALEFFVAIAEGEPNFLRASFVPICETMLSIIGNKAIESDLRHLAVEFMITLAESKPVFFRKSPVILGKTIPLLLTYMSDVEDDPEWYNQEEEDESEQTNHEIALESLDRLSLALGGKSVAPLIFQILPELLNSSQWQHRHGALMTISVIGEGCEKYLKAHLAEVINVLVKLFSDPHPRVRWAACNTAGQMATDFGPTFQKKFHAQILPCLVAVMNDPSVPKVQSHAACALINFCENCKPSILHPYLDGLLAKLSALLQLQNKMVQEQAITAVAAIAECVKGDFTKYYDAFMPFLKSVLSHATDKSLKKMRGRAMECASLIGVAVGKERFRNDAKDIMQLLAATPVTSMEPDDPQISFVLQAWARMCTSLGEEFVPYLPLVMPSLLASAKVPPDIIVTDEDAETPEGFEVIAIGDKQIGIKTSTMEDKATACNMIFCYVTELKEHFFEFVEPVAQIMVPLVTFYYHESVRSAAVQTMAPLLQTAVSGLEKRGKPKTEAIGLFDHVFSKLLEGAKAEPDIEILTYMVEGIHECLEVMGENSLNPEKLTALVELLKVLFGDFAERRSKREVEKGEEPDFDEEEADKLEEENQTEEELLAGLSEVITKLCKYVKAPFLPYFDQLLPFATGLLAPERRPHDRQIGLCIFDDLVENLKEASLPYFPHFLQPMVAYMSDPDAALRQAAVFGAGVVAEVGGPHVAAIIPEITNKLVAVIQDPESRSEDNVYATENAISSLGKICLFQSQVVNVGQYLPLWLSSLPVTEDKIESKVIYSHLCSFIESSNQHLFGPGGQNIPKILSVLVETLGSELIDAPLTTRMVNILKQMKNSIPEAQILQILNNEQKVKWSQFGI